MKIYLKNDAGVTKQVKVGFSWTTLFFAFFPALFRGDLKWAVIMFIISAVVGPFTLGIGAWISGIIFSFVYNKIYIKELVIVLQQKKQEQCLRITRLLRE